MSELFQLTASSWNSAFFLCFLCLSSEFTTPLGVNAVKHSVSSYPASKGTPSVAGRLLYTHLHHYLNNIAGSGLSSLIGTLSQLYLLVLKKALRTNDFT
jgi:hypothetical protein